MVELLPLPLGSEGVLHGASIELRGADVRDEESEGGIRSLLGADAVDAPVLVGGVHHVIPMTLPSSVQIAVDLPGVDLRSVVLLDEPVADALDPLVVVEPLLTVAFVVNLVPHPTGRCALGLDLELIRAALVLDRVQSHLASHLPLHGVVVLPPVPHEVEKVAAVGPALVVTAVVVVGSLELGVRVEDDGPENFALLRILRVVSNEILQFDTKK